MWIQREISLSNKKRGIHLITENILDELDELQNFKTGLLNVFIQHTSASLTINENADPDVRRDMEKHLSKMVPENQPYYEHNSEGSDDMPAHIKNSLLGSSLTIPVKDGKLLLGTWQGIYLCEHRNNGGRRKIVLTLTGETT